MVGHDVWHKDVLTGWRLYVTIKLQLIDCTQKRFNISPKKSIANKRRYEEEAMKYYKAKIDWLIKQKQVPPVLPISARETARAYMPLIVFENQYDRPIFEDNVSHVPLWSSVIFNDCIDGATTIASIRYLAYNAPYEFIKPHAKFELFEGARLVATGEIIE